MSEPVSELRVDIRVERGAFALAAQFRTPLAGVTAIFGPSGSGKSLLLSAIAGIAPGVVGRIEFDGEMLEDTASGVRLASHLRGVGLVFQDARLFPHLSVRGNLLYAAKRAPEPERALGAVEHWAQRFDIAHALDRRIGGLSGGERARVALARAVLSQPKLLMLDEPFAALDGRRRRDFLGALAALSAERNLPMLIVTHQIDDVACLADHVVALAGGGVAATGPANQTLVLPAFQALLDPRDTGAPVRADALKGGASADRATGRAAWVRADAVLLATSPPQGLSARNVWPGRIAGLTREAGGAVLTRLETEVGPVFARVTADAATELQLAEGRDAWAIAKTHAL